MIPPIPPISAAQPGNLASAAPVGPAGATGAAGPAGATPGASGAIVGSQLPGSSFADSLGRALDSLQSVTQGADSTSMAAAAGRASLADLVVQTSEAQLETQLFTTVRDKAVAAYTDIMNMPA